MSSKRISFALGPLSNREPEYQNQNTLVIDKHGRIRYVALSRRALALPPEILAEIFIHCLPDNDFITPDPTAAPLVLCSVCRRWREVALSTPGLWSSLVLDLQSATKTNASSVALYQAWLSRARNTPLSLSLRDPDEKVAPELVRPLLQSIAVLWRQWRVIHLDLAVNFIESLFSSEGSPSREFPLLEMVAIACYNEPNLPICHTPRLCEIFLPTYPPVQRLHFPWAQITTLKINDIPLSTCLKIFANVSNLVRGGFEIRGDGSTVPPSISSLDHVETLTLAGILLGDAETIPLTVLNCLKAPALKNLMLRPPNWFGMWSHSDSWDVSPFLSFLSRSSIQLRSLALSLVLTTADILIDCLKAVPSLEYLELEPLRVVDMNTLFNRLTRDSNFLPNLGSIHIFFSAHTGVHSINPSVLVKMLCWRWTAVGVIRLRFFNMAHSINRPPFLDEDANSEFRRLRKEGMEVYLGKERPGIDTFVTGSSVY
ncbi:hypothetical protein B0H19DRAFT_1113124 [Mycena capillaripes]|nr:hypothetical protein B0H19DRAFT_1113124 [Mycena capillaripes]